MVTKSAIIEIALETMEETFKGFCQIEMEDLYYDDLCKIDIEYLQK